MGMTECSFLGVAWSTCLGSGGRKARRPLFLIRMATSPSPHSGEEARRALLSTVIAYKGQDCFKNMPWSAEDMESRSLSLFGHVKFTKAYSASWVSSWFFPVY